MIPPRYFDRVRAEVSWSKLMRILGFTPRRAGNGDLVIRCVFHREKTPSLRMSQGKAIFYCFGCGCHDDQFGFVLRHRYAVLEGNRSMIKTIRFFERHFDIPSPITHPEVYKK